MICVPVTLNHIKLLIAFDERKHCNTPKSNTCHQVRAQCSRPTEIRQARITHATRNRIMLLAQITDKP
jgi:hypothetical protein